ncbi:SAM-dependent methyltransferase [Spongiactinospora rosea]|nr:SAM-dependent methyltransferase [Spongiactinospora rosea]
MTIDPSIANTARVYDRLLGGKDNFPADRKVAKEITERAPHIPKLARANRDLLIRVVRHLADHNLVGQYLDIGCGLPTQENIHQVAQALVPETEVVYVDRDPVVIRHGHALLATNARTRMVQADLCDPELILRRAAETLDFDRPIALMMIAVLHFFPDDTGVHAIVRRLVDALPAGSYVVISHATNDPMLAAAAEAYDVPGVKPVLRDAGELTAFFAGLTLTEPVQPIDRILPDDDDDDDDDLPGLEIYQNGGPVRMPVSVLGGIGHKS